MRYFETKILANGKRVVLDANGKRYPKHEEQATLKLLDETEAEYRRRIRRRG